MSEVLSAPIDVTPGSVISYEHSLGLPGFEDTVARQLQPKFSDFLWEGRRRLKDFLRPPGFNGELAKIVLESLPDPLDELIATKQQGIHVSSDPNGTKTKYVNGEPTDEHRSNVAVCFALSAMARSTSGGDIGTITSKLWYGPRAIREQDAILRLVAAPAYDAAAFERFLPRRGRAHHIGRLALPHAAIPTEPARTRGKLDHYTV